MANIAGKPSDAFATLVAEFNKLRADFIDLRTKYEAHVHGGITAGAANSAVRGAGAAAAAVTSADLSNSPQGAGKS